MNVEHFSGLVEKLWPGKLNDQQMAVICKRLDRLALSSEQVEAAVERVFAEPTGKRPLQERLIEQLRDASNPLRAVRAGMTAGDQTFPQFIRVQWKCGGTDAEVVIQWHTALRDKARRVYGEVPERPHIFEAWGDFRRWVCESDEHVEALMFDLYGEQGLEFCQRQRALKVYSRELRERLMGGERLSSIAASLFPACSASNGGGNRRSGGGE